MLEGVHMAVYDRKNHCFHCTLTYYGPPAAGKTATLMGISAYFKDMGTILSEIDSYVTENSRGIRLTIPGLRPIHGLPVQIHLRAIPGVTLYERYLLAILKDVDGVMFVADCQRVKLQENIRYLQKVARELTNQHQRFSQFPVVLQYNKRDLPSALPATILDKYLNPLGWPTFETIGCRLPQPDHEPWITMRTIDALKALQELVLTKLNTQPLKLGF
jgi:mutual gliding-motility protein MglA